MRVCGKDLVNYLCCVPHDSDISCCSGHDWKNGVGINAKFIGGTPSVYSFIVVGKTIFCL